MDGVDVARRLRDVEGDAARVLLAEGLSTSFGRSFPYLGSTCTFTAGETLYFDRNNVAARDVRDLLRPAAQHAHGLLGALYVQILLAAQLVLWALDASLLPCGAGTAEDEAEGVEPAHSTGGPHLGYVHHQAANLVTSTGGANCRVVQRTLVRVLHAVFPRSAVATA